MKNINGSFLFRWLKKHWVYSSVSILGIAVSSCCALLIGVYVLFHLGYNRFFEEQENIYRITVDIGKEEVDETGLCSFAMGPQVSRLYPEIQSFTRIMGGNSATKITYDNASFSQVGVTMVDTGFFDVFSFEVLQGEERHFLSQPQQIVLTESLANTLFGKENALGKSLTLNSTDVTVVGVIQDPPQQSDIQFTALVSIQTLPQGAFDTFMQDWMRLMSQTYVKTHNPVTDERWGAIFSQIREDFALPWLKSNGVDNNLDFRAQSIAELHLDNSKVHDIPKGNPLHLVIFSAVAFLLVLVAITNFVNLTIAQQMTRLKELAVRRMSGASIKDIRWQFFTESFVVLALSYIAAIGLTEVCMPVYEVYSGIELNTQLLFSSTNMAWFVGLFAFLVVAGAVYPSFYLSKRPLSLLLKPSTVSYNGVGWLRKGLLLLQFAFAIFMFVSSLVVFMQLKFIDAYDLGVDHEKVVSIYMPKDSSYTRKSDVIRRGFEHLPNVESVSLSGTLPGLGQGELLFRIEQKGMLENQTIKFMFVDYAFLQTIGADVLAGRNFDPSRPNDYTSAFLINESGASKYWGLDKALGKRVQWGLYADNRAANDGEVVGVFEDFRFETLHNPLEPLILVYNPNNSGLLNLRLTHKATEKDVQMIKEVWSSLTEGDEFNYFFLSHQIADRYKEERQMLSVFWVFSGASIGLSLLGVFAMTFFFAKQKTKEIGIRSILGASPLNIGLLLTKEMLPLFLIGALLGAVGSFFAANYWLSQFNDHVFFSVWHIVMGVIAVAALLCSVIIFQTFRTQQNDPIQALRFE